MSETKSRKLRIFKSTMPMVQFVFSGRTPDGKENGIAGKAAPFIAGEYRTDHPAEIEELEREINNRHPHIFIDKDRYEMDAEDVDPTIALKKKHYAEFMQEQARAMNNGDVGKTDASGGTGTGMGTSAGANQGAADSNAGAALIHGVGAGVGAKLAALASLGKK